MDGVKLFVMLGYGEDFGLGCRSLEFKTEQLTAKQATEVVRLVKGYNDYVGEIVAEAVLAIGEVWKSDYQQVTFQFGRECSPVLYVHFPYWLKQAEKLGEAERSEMIRHSRSIIEAAKPDELGLDDWGNLRAWWD